MERLGGLWAMAHHGGCECSRACSQAARAGEAEALRRAEALELELQDSREAAHRAELQQQDERARC